MPAAAIERKHMAVPFLEFKTVDEAKGTFQGYLAVFNNVDLGGDVIEPGAFKKTLSELERKQKANKSPYLVPILWQHNPHEPIGGFTMMREDANGLYVEGELDLDIEQGRRAYSGLKKGYLRGLSIGYDAVKEQWQGNIRRLKELRLWEGSVVTWPMNPEANVDSVKSAEGKARDFNTILQSTDLWNRWWNLFDALKTAVRDAMADDALSDKEAAIKDAVAAFQVALLAWVTEALESGWFEREMKNADLSREHQMADKIAASLQAALVLPDATREPAPATPDGAGMTAQEPGSGGASRDTTPDNTRGDNAREPGPASATTPEDAKQLASLLAQMKAYAERKGVS